MPLVLGVVLWVSSIALIFVGLQLRMKPLLLVGAFELLLALFVTVVVFGVGKRR